MVAIANMLTMDLLRSNRHRLPDWNAMIVKTRRILSSDHYKSQSAKKASIKEALETLGPLVSGQEARLSWRPRAFITYYVQAIANSRQLSFSCVNGEQVLRIAGECYTFHIWLDGTENGSYVKEVQLLFGDRDSPMKCAELTEELKKGNFEELKTHLDGLEEVFSIPGNKTTRMKSFLSLQSLEEDLCKLSQLYGPSYTLSVSNTELSGVARLRSSVNAALIGIASARSGGRGARLLFYVSPRDIVTAVYREQKNGGKLGDTFYNNPKALWRHNLGYILGFQIKNTADNTENPMPIIPLVTLQRGADGAMQPHFSSSTNVNHAPLPAHFCLKFERPIVIPVTQLKRIETVTSLPTNLGDGQDYIGLLMKIAGLDSDIYAPDRPVFVKYMSSAQIYHISCAMRAHIVESLPFLSPRQLPQLIEILREVVNLQTLLGSVLNAANNSQQERHMDYVSVYQIQIPNLNTVAVSLCDFVDDDNKPLRFDIEIGSQPCYGVCVTAVKVSWTEAFSDANPVDILRQHHSIPMVARWLGRKLSTNDPELQADVARLLTRIQQRQSDAASRRRRPALSVSIADSFVKIQEANQLLTVADGPTFDLDPAQLPESIPTLKPNPPPAPPPPPPPPPILPHMSGMVTPGSMGSQHVSASVPGSISSHPSQSPHDPGGVGQMAGHTSHSSHFNTIVTPPHMAPAPSAPPPSSRYHSGHYPTSQLDELLRDDKSVIGPHSGYPQQHSHQTSPHTQGVSQQQAPTTHTDPDKNSVLVSLLNEDSVTPLNVRQMPGNPPRPGSPMSAASMMRSNSSGTPNTQASQRSMLPPQTPPMHNPSSAMQPHIQQQPQPQQQQSQQPPQQQQQYQQQQIQPQQQQQYHQVQQSQQQQQSSQGTTMSAQQQQQHQQMPPHSQHQSGQPGGTPPPPPPHYHQPMPGSQQGRPSMGPSMASPVHHMMTPSPRQSPGPLGTLTSPTPDSNRMSPIRSMPGVMGMSPHHVQSHNMSTMPLQHQSQTQQQQSHPQQQVQQQQAQQVPQQQFQQQQEVSLQQQQQRQLAHQQQQTQPHQQQAYQQHHQQQPPMRPPSTGSWTGSSMGTASSGGNPMYQTSMQQPVAITSPVAIQSGGMATSVKSKKPRKRRAAPTDISKQAPSNVKRRMSDSEGSNPPGSAGFDVSPDNMSNLSRALPVQLQSQHQQPHQMQSMDQQHHQLQSQQPQQQPQHQALHQDFQQHHHQQQQLHQQHQHLQQQQQQHMHMAQSESQMCMHPGSSTAAGQHGHVGVGSNQPVSSAGGVQLLYSGQFGMKRSQTTPAPGQQTTKIAPAGMTASGGGNTQLATLLESGTTMPTSAPMSGPHHPTKSASSGNLSQPAKDPYEFDDTAPTHLPTPQHTSWSGNSSTTGGNCAVSTITSVTPCSGGQTTGMHNATSAAPSAVIVSSTCNDSVKPPLKLTIRSAPANSGGSALESVLCDKKEKSNCYASGSIQAQNSVALSVPHSMSQVSKKSKKIKSGGKPQNLTDLIHHPTSLPSIQTSSISNTVGGGMPVPNIPGTTVLPIGQLPPQVPPQFLKKQRKRKRESPGGMNFNEQNSPNGGEKKKDKKKPGRKRKEQGPVAILPNVPGAMGNMPGGMMVQNNTNYGNLTTTSGIMNNGQPGLPTTAIPGTCINNDPKQPPLKVSFHAKNKDGKAGGGGAKLPSSATEMGAAAKFGLQKNKEKKSAIMGNAIGPGAAVPGMNISNEKLGNGAVGTGVVGPGAQPPASGLLLSALSKNNFKIPKKKSSGDSPNSTTTTTTSNPGSSVNVSASGNTLSPSSTTSSSTISSSTVNQGLQNLGVPPGSNPGNTSSSSPTGGPPISRQPGLARPRAPTHISGPSNVHGYQPARFQGAQQGNRFPNPNAVGAMGGASGQHPKNARPLLPAGGGFVRQPSQSSHGSNETPPHMIPNQQNVPSTHQMPVEHQHQQHEQSQPQQTQQQSQPSQLQLQHQPEQQTQQQQQQPQLQPQQTQDQQQQQLQLQQHLIQQQQMQSRGGNGGCGNVPNSGVGTSTSGAQASGGNKNRKGYSISMVIDKLHERRGREEHTAGPPQPGSNNGGNSNGNSNNGGPGAAAGNRASGDNIFEKFRGSGAGSAANDTYEVMKSTKDTPDSPTESVSAGGASSESHSASGSTEKVIPVTRSGDPSGETSTIATNMATPKGDSK